MAAFSTRRRSVDQVFKPDMQVDPVTWPGLKGPGPFLKLKMWWGPRPFLQVAFILSLALIILALGWSVSASMARVGISPGFDFLRRSANFEIGEQVIPFSAGDSYLRALVVGFLNTAKVAILGCILATILGVAVALAGLSGNLLLASITRTYIEIIRNTPLLLQLFFWIALVQALPPPRRAFSALDTVYLSNRGIFLPGPIIENATGGTWLALLAIAVFSAFAIGAAIRKGLPIKRVAAFAIPAIILSVWGAFAVTGAWIRFDVPQLSGFNIRGGCSMTPEFAALLTGLVVKFSASIAEIVRAGILSVKQGQWEAGRALGLNNGQIIRLIVLPQALRVITPLTTSNYLDLTKDSSLAVAIGYPDLVSIANTTANTTGQAFEALTILVAVYVTLNIGVSLIMNSYNTRVALKGGRPA